MIDEHNENQSADGALAPSAAPAAEDYRENLDDDLEGLHVEDKITHKFSRQIKDGTATYDELTFDLGGLTNEDMMYISRLMTRKGQAQEAAVGYLSDIYVSNVLALAAKVPLTTIGKIPIADATFLVSKAQAFLSKFVRLAKPRKN